MGKQPNRTSEDNIGLNYPTNVQIEVTEDCNHKCFYCYNFWREDDPKNNKMSLENSDKLMDIVSEQIKPFNITITGGEPLMNMPTTLNIANKLYEKNTPVTLNTNLALLTPNKIKQLKEANEGMDFLVSLPSIKDKYFTDIVGVPTMNKVLNNLEKLVDSGFKPVINMVVHKMNKDDVYEQGKFLSENYGIKSFAMTPALRPAFRPDSGYHLTNEETVKTLRDLVRLKEDTGMEINALEVIPYCALPDDLRENPTFRRSCSAGRVAVQIGYDGNIRACGHSPFKEGNVFEEPFKDIWGRLNTFRENKYVPEECDGCVEIDSCKGGCRYEGLQEGEELNKKDSRMIGKLENKVFSQKLENIDSNINYQVNSYITRKESEDSYLLYNGDTLLVNEQFKNFVDGIKPVGLRVNDFPDYYKHKAETFAKILKSKGFLK